MKTYVIKKVEEVDKGRKVILGWAIYDGDRIVHDVISKDRRERVDHLHVLYSLKWIDVLPEQLNEFKGLGLE